MIADYSHPPKNASDLNSSVVDLSSDMECIIRREERLIPSGLLLCIIAPNPYSTAPVTVVRCKGSSRPTAMNLPIFINVDPGGSKSPSRSPASLLSISKKLSAKLIKESQKALLQIP